MISGALVLSKSYDNIGVYLKKRMSRILLPLLFWSMVYISKDILIRILKGDGITVAESLKHAFFCLKNGAHTHFWFIYTLLGLYLLFPMVAKWISRSTKVEMEYFIGIWLLTVLLRIPSVKAFFPNITLIYFSGYIGFPILGYYLYKHTFIHADRHKTVPLLMIIIGNLITIFGYYFASKYRDVFSYDFYHYLTPNVILVSAGVFLFFKNGVQLNEKAAMWVRYFSKYSYGTYFVHVLVLALVSNYIYSFSFIRPALGIPIVSILCFVISTFIVWGIHKLPFGKYVSG